MPGPAGVAGRGADGEGPEAHAGGAAAARELREALYRLAVARLRNEDLDSRDRALVNRWAAAPPR
ncbi:ABATE domain-containing protein, partial [Corallococcus sp. CA053C]|uniref:ABATE domain-containing protein n=1 Tax=Corallococcus sp. CA053C TaxID=2316732 RepID=UPI0034CDDDD7